MKLYQVRKGQFVYFNNVLHKVYGVKPMYKKSVHLMKLSDLSQHLATAVEVDKYKPKDHDSFIFNHKAYTLAKDQKAKAGDYILIHNPMPDSLDTYTLNEIDMVETVDKQGVITSNSHGIKHNEYLLMVPGRSDESHPIDFLNGTERLQETDFSKISNANDVIAPTIGDVYKQKDHDDFIEAMVVALRGQTVFLGGGLEITQTELMNSEKWEFLYNLNDK